MSDSTPATVPNAAEEAKKMVLIINILYVVSFSGFTGIVALVLAYMKRSQAVGTIWESHFTYAIRTFWIGFGLAMIAVVLSFVLIGLFMWPLIGIWLIVRIVRAFLAWNDNVAIPDPKRFF